DTEPTGGADQRHGGLGPRAGHLQGGGAAGLGERAVGQEGATPRGLGVADAAGYDGGRQAPDRAAALVDQAGLAGQALAVLGDPDQVAHAATDVAAGEHAHAAGVAV